MSAAYVIITVVTIAANVWATAVDLAQPGWLLTNMAEVGVARSWLPPLGVRRGAGAAGQAGQPRRQRGPSSSGGGQSPGSSARRRM